MKSFTKSEEPGEMSKWRNEDPDETENECEAGADGDEEPDGE